MTTVSKVLENISYELKIRVKAKKNERGLK